MNPKDIVFFTVISDTYKPLSKYIINSFKYFHPDIEHHIFWQSDIDELVKKEVWCYAAFGKKLAYYYKLVVQLDADCIVCDRLTEVINGDYDLAAPVNNNFSNRFYISLAGIKDNYINAGLVASTVPSFWDHWYKKVVEFKDNQAFVYKEQDVLNLIFHFSTYKTKYLDGRNTKLYYGTSSRDKWGAAQMVNGKMYIGGRQVKVIHEAGGDKIENKLNYEKYFREDVISFLDRVCQPQQ